jgi:hypothetical protein
MIIFMMLFCITFTTIQSNNAQEKDYEAVSLEKSGNESKGVDLVKWTEFSSVLKPSLVDDLGVFATHDIPSGTVLFAGRKHKIRRLKIEDIPTELIKYCVNITNKECVCPERFDRMEIGWYINYSSTPNIAKKKRDDLLAMDEISSEFYAIKDIKAGDEILLDASYMTYED